MEKLKANKTIIIHILIIIIGIVFISLSAFHSSTWFDESYSVGMAGHSFKDIWLIGENDVHPILYYWILHIINLIFGNQIILYRLLSVLAIAILGILGITHIRKDFGPKVGILFSFLVYFLPVNLVYSGEIRMYSFAMLFVSIMAIYAYRIYKNNKENVDGNSTEKGKKNKKAQIKNWILFGIFSLASCYTHYYSLVAAGIVNIALFIYFVKQSVKEKKFIQGLKAFIITGIIQIVAYLPWLIVMYEKLSQGSGGFWITLSFPGSLIEMFTFQFTGNLGGTRYVPNWVAGTFGIALCVYVIYLWIKNRKNKEENRPAKYAIIFYGLVLLAVGLVSLIIWQPIIYARYLLCITGLIMFFFSFFMAKYGNKYINTAICIISLVMAIYINIGLIQANYDNSNNEMFNYLQENIQSEDAIIYDNDLVGFNISVHYPETQKYFWDICNWNVEKAYQAFGPNFDIIYNLDEIQDFSGRIWAINRNGYAIAEKIEQVLGGKVIQKQEFTAAYRGDHYTFCLLEID